MPIRLEGFIDDGRGEPLADIPAVATILGTSTVVDTTITDDDGHWLFTGLPTANEYVVTLSDPAGNAVSRSVWSGEMRELWVRDRLDVAGLPVLVDPAAGNALLWTATGLFAASGMTQAAADLRYVNLDGDTMTGSLDVGGDVVISGTLMAGGGTLQVADGTVLVLSELLVGGAARPVTVSPTAGNTLTWDATGLYSAGGLTQAAADLRYEPIDTMYTKAEADARYPQKTDVDPYPNYLTVTEADALFLTPAEGNAAYATSAHNHDTTYVQLTGGSVMTGLLGPTSNNTRDLGTTALRWRKLWAVDAEFTNAPTVGGSALLTATAADALFLTPAEGNTAYATAAHNHDTSYVQLTGGSVMTGLLGPSTHNTRDLGTTGTRWRALYGMTGDFTTSLTVATKPITPSPDAANIIEFRANGLYAAAGAVTDIWVNTGGDTMTGDLNMTANVLPTVTNVRSLGSTSLRWLKVWATDADFTNAPTVGGAALLTATAADALFLTPAEGNTAYVGLAGGSVMTGLLGPTTTNTRDLGTTALRWRKLWSVDADLSGNAAVLGTLTASGLLKGQAGLDITGDAVFATSNVSINGTLGATGLVSASGGLHVGAGGAAPGELVVKGASSLHADITLIEGNTANGYLVSAIASDGGFFIQRFVSPSTYTARLSISSAGLVALPGGLTVNSRPVIMAGCRVYHNANQTITTGVTTALAFNSERFDTDSFHDTVTNNSRLTVPAGMAGKYLIFANVEWGPVADATWRLMQIRLGGATVIGRVAGPNNNSASFGTVQPLAFTYDLAVGDYVECMVRHERGTNLDVALSTGYQCEFGMQRVG